jgi:hypothetical protein
MRSSPAMRRYRIAVGHGLSFVMPGLAPGIHVFRATGKDVDGRDRPGHDGESEHDRNMR